MKKGTGSCRCSFFMSGPSVSVLAIRVIYVNDNLDYYEPVNEFDKRSYI